MRAIATTVSGLALLVSAASLAVAAPASSPPPRQAEPAKEEPRRVETSGDARFRLEETKGSDGTPARFRGRVRLRFQSTYRATSDLSLGARMTTGDPNDPNSPYQDLGDLFEKFPVSLDRLFLRWTPGDAVEVLAGKFGDPRMTNPVYGETVWDVDVQPEGLAARVEWGRESGLRGSLSAGGYVMLERSRGDDVPLLVAQASATAPLVDGWRLGAAVGTSLYGDVAPGDDPRLLRGNATLDRDADGRPDAFASDFELLELLVHARSESLAEPLVLAGQLVRNLGTDLPSTGWTLGASWGETRRPGDWRLYWQFQRIEQDAVFAAFVQDDFTVATDYRGHVLGLGIGLPGGGVLHAWGLAGRRLLAGDDTVWRFRLDTTFPF